MLVDEVKEKSNITLILIEIRKGMIGKMDSMFDALKTEGKARIIQELVPGKQITLAHVIANPDPVLYQKLGLDPAADYKTSAIGIITLSPAETAIIAGDIATKASGAELGFVDRFSGTLIVVGSVSQIEEAVDAVCTYVRETLGFTVCPITKT